MSNDTLFSVLLILICASVWIVASMKPKGEKGVFVGIGGFRLTDTMAIGILVVLSLLTLGSNLYLLKYQPGILNSTAVTAVLWFVIGFLFINMALFVYRWMRGSFASGTGNAPYANKPGVQMVMLAVKNIRGSGFRSAAVFLCVLGIAGFLLSTTIVIKGSQDSLDAGIKRLGADIIVVPAGAEEKVETALLMGKPTSVWMPTSSLDQVKAVPGVVAVSPQVFLASMYGASCCAVNEMFMVAYDPKTDFTITPWLKRNLGRELGKGESIGGTYVFVPEGEKDIKLYGYHVTLNGNLEPTGTGIDQTMFMTVDTARAMARNSSTMAEAPLEVPTDSISAIMVKTAPGVDVHKVALQIVRDTTGLVPIESPNLFGAFRSQMSGLLWVFFALTIVIWALAALMMGVNFSLAANERKREMAVLRAVGAMPSFVFRLILTEASLIAAGGAVVGIALAGSIIYMFKDWLAASLKMPFLFPSISSFLGLFGAGVALAIVTVTLSALVPAIRISRQELAIAMRE